MIAADIMSRSVVAISPDAPLVQALRLMIDHHVSGLPVIDMEGQAVGILTEGDLMRRAETGTEGQAPGWFASFFTPGRLAGQYVHTHGRRVSEIMTQPATVVEENAALSDAVALMQRMKIKRLPVVRGEKVVGIVSRADLVRVLAHTLGAPAATADDAVIRRKIVDGLAAEPWGQSKSIGVAVENGAVLLDGSVFDMRERMAISVLAENVPGVKRVENRLVCIEPRSGVLIYNPDEEVNSAVSDQVAH